MIRMRRRLPKGTLPLILYLIGAALIISGLYRFWQGYSAKSPSVLTESEASSLVPSDSTWQDNPPPSSSDGNDLLGSMLKVTLKGSEGANQKGPSESLYPERPASGEQLGTLTIPALEMSLPIYEGTEESELKKGVGHYAGSVLPGEKDNCVLSGHRDTVFSELSQLKKGDELIVETSAGTFTYRIRKIRIVEKDDTTVIVSTPQAALTLTTCYPFTYIGSAPQRYILSAYLVQSSEDR